MNPLISIEQTEAQPVATEFTGGDVAKDEETSICEVLSAPSRGIFCSLKLQPRQQPQTLDLPLLLMSFNLCRLETVEPIKYFPVAG